MKPVNVKNLLELALTQSKLIIPLVKTAILALTKVGARYLFKLPFCNPLRLESVLDMIPLFVSLTTLVILEEFVLMLMEPLNANILKDPIIIHAMI